MEQCSAPQVFLQGLDDLRRQGVQGRTEGMIAAWKSLRILGLLREAIPIFVEYLQQSGMSVVDWASPGAILWTAGTQIMKGNVLVAGVDGNWCIF